MRTPRYSARIKKLYEATRKSAKSLYHCPKCGKKKVKRESYSIWKCKSCGAKIAGGAYSLTTTVGEMARRIIKESE